MFTAASFSHCFCCGGAPRRQFLRGAAGTALFASGRLGAFAQHRSGIVDVHHHIVPRFWFDEVRDVIAAQGGGRIVPNWLGWSPQRAVAEMDQKQVETAVLSISTPGIW